MRISISLPHDIGQFSSGVPHHHSPLFTSYQTSTISLILTFSSSNNIRQPTKFHSLSQFLHTSLIFIYTNKKPIFRFSTPAPEKSHGFPFLHLPGNRLKNPPRPLPLLLQNPPLLPPPHQLLLPKLHPKKWRPTRVHSPLPPQPLPLLPLSHLPISPLHSLLHLPKPHHRSHHHLQPTPPSIPPPNHVISAFTGLSVTVDFPSSNLQFFLIRGSPYITFSPLRTSKLPISISTPHSITSFSSNTSNTKYSIKLSNNQTWLVYSSLPIKLARNVSVIYSPCPFSGVMRIALVPNSDPENELVLDRYYSCYPVSGDAWVTEPFSGVCNWDTRGSGDDQLLMLAHPLHLRLLSDMGVCVLNYFRYRSIDGDLVGVVGNTWRLRVEPVPITWHSIKGVSKDSFPEIVSALSKDVGALDVRKISTTSSCFYGKLIARAARLALIAEEVSYQEVIPIVVKFLKDTIEPWLDGSFPGC